MECEARRRGIYRRLDRPITAIATHEAPRSFNARAIALYRKLGFEVEGVRKRQFRVRDTWVDEVLMAKGLE